jgi:hypothetical protein
MVYSRGYHVKFQVFHEHHMSDRLHLLVAVEAFSLTLGLAQWRNTQAEQQGGEGITLEQPPLELNRYPGQQG